MYRAVFINHDMTIQQRKTFKILRQELQERRNNGEQVVIYKGTITNVSKIQESRAQNFQN
jgi:preprotein translocase subunit YajC